MTTPKKILFYSLLWVPTLVFLLMLEITFRAYLYYQDVQLDEQLAAIGNSKRLNSNTLLRLKNMVDWNANPKIIYHLKPAISGVFEGQSITTNAHGFRGSLVALEKSNATLRIAGIGDSVMFGWGVTDSETYLSTLGRDLKDDGCGPAVEVINSAVPGYNAVMAVATLESKLLDYKPDIVIYHYVLNDLSLPSFIRMKNPIFKLDVSFLWQALQQRMSNQQMVDYRLNKPPKNLRHQSYLGNEEDIPTDYKDLIGLSAFGNAIARLAALAKQYNFQPIVFSHFSIANAELKIFEEHGLPVLNSYPDAQKYLAGQNQTIYLGSALTVSEKDRHPSAIYHRIISKYLARELAKTKACW